MPRDGKHGWILFGDTLRVELDLSQIDISKEALDFRSWKSVGDDVVQATFDCFMANIRSYHAKKRPLNWLDVRVIGPEKYHHYQGVYPVHQSKKSDEP